MIDKEAMTEAILKCLGPEYSDEDKEELRTLYRGYHQDKDFDTFVKIREFKPRSRRQSAVPKTGSGDAIPDNGLVN